MAKIAEPRAGEPIRLVRTSKGEARYRVVLDADPDPKTGKRRQVRSTHGSLTAARDHVAQWRSDRRRGVLVAGDKTKFSDYAEAWIQAKAASPKTRETTIAGYRTHVNNANAAFGNKSLSHIARADVETLMVDYAAKGRTQTSSGYLLRIVSAIFRRAIDEGLVVRNPTRGVEVLGKPAKEREALTPADIAKVRAWLAEDPRSKPLFACWLLTLYGLRRGEVMGLRWSDVDLGVDEPSISIERSRVRLGIGGQAEQVGAPKTRNGYRTLYINEMPALVKALREMREAQLAAYGARQVRDGYLAVWPDGSPYPPHRWSELWEEAITATGVTAVSLHAARHSSVTTMRDAGIPDHIVAEWHGHDENIMRRTYSHAHEKQLRGAGRALEGAYGQ